MCGILGFATDKPSDQHYEVLKKLFVQSAQRGKDATGIAIHRGKDGILVVKQAVEAEKFVEEVLPGLRGDIAKAHLVIGHTRKWTVGKPDNNNNNHPVMGDKYVLVHNGSCTQVDKVEGYHYKGEVDSELMLAQIEKNGLKGVAELGWGSAALLILDKTDPKHLFLWRHNEPTSLGYDEATSTVYIASLETYLKKCMPGKFNFFPSRLDVEQTAENHLYHLSVGGLDLTDKGEIDVVRRYHSRSSSNTGTNTNGGKGNWRGRQTYIWDAKLQRMVPYEDYKDATYRSWMEHQQENLKKIQEERSKGNKDALPGVDVTAYDQCAEELRNLVWDKESCAWLTEDEASSDEADMEHNGEHMAAEMSLTRYYLGDKTSLENWIEVKNTPCFVSNDGVLVKCLDPVLKKWFITTTKVAVAEGLMKDTVEGGKS